MATVDEPPTQTTLCKKCLEFEFELIRPLSYRHSKQLTWGVSFRHEISPRDMVSSAADGCRLCSVLASGLLGDLNDSQNIEQRLAAYEAAEREEFAEHSPQNPLSMDFVLSLQDDFLRFRSREPFDQGIIFLDLSSAFVFTHCPLDARFFLATELGNQAFHQGRFVGRSLLEERRFDVAKQWIRKCENEHHVCRQVGHGELQVPTRLIDIRECRSRNDMRLLETKNEHYKYVTLSYRWGKDRQYLTTEQNYDQRLAGFSQDDLPSTLKDAVIATRGLGFRYLWIDALCIIQDNPCDWERECARMGSIYQGAAVTIAAPVAAEPTTGFLQAQYIPSTGNNKSCNLRYRDENNQVVGSVELMTVGRSRTVEDLLCFEPSSVLENRGWILQERLFSPRILYFGSQQVYWECNEDTSFQALLPSARTEDLEGLDSWGRTLNKKMPLTDKARLQTWWCDLVSSYTRCSLTCSTDRLPAISGIAKQLQRSTGDTYLAGLWRSHLPRALLWNVDSSEDEKVQEQNPYLAPSWSWASADGRTKYPSQEPLWFPFTDLVQIQTCLPGSDPFGMVSAGLLQLEGPIRCGFVSRLESNEPTSFFYLPSPSYSVFPFGRFFPDRPHGFWRESSKFSELICMPIAWKADYSRGAYITWAMGLRMHTETGQYERVGLIRIDIEGRDAGIEWFKDAEVKVIEII